MRHRTTVRSVLHITICALTLAWIACGSDESKPPAEASPADAGAATEAEGASPTGEPVAPAADGEAQVTEHVIPEGFPSDVSVYPGAKVGPAMTMPGLGVFVTFESEDDVSAVLDHYRTSLADSGWSVSDIPDVGLDAKKDSRSVTIRARENETGKTDIAVNVKES
jgi:hypothetical protein